MKSIRLPFVFVFFISLISPARACSKCFESSPYEKGLIGSVLFLLPIPFLIVGAVSAWIYWICRTRARENPNGR